MTKRPLPADIPVKSLREVIGMIRKFSLVLAVSAALFVVAAAHPSPAQASFQICNESGEHISVAIAYHNADAGNWLSRGWWNLDNGECKTPVGGDLKNQYYYLYADGDQHYWSGSHSFCVDDNNAFDLNDADNVCSYVTKDFFEVDTGDAVSYTYTFR